MSILPRRLTTLAGIIWVLVGGMLLTRSVPMIESASEQSGWTTTIVALVIGALLGAGKGRFVLSKTARRNRSRIEALPSAYIWNVFTGKTWLLVVGMIGLGLLLRGGAAAGWFNWASIAGIYAGIGAAMLVSSWMYFRAIPLPLPTRVESIEPQPPRRIGVMVANLGTPDEPTTKAVRRYLRQFLWDSRVVEVWRWLWFVILNGIILPLRSPRSARAYRRVWTEEGSPLMTNSQAICDALAEQLGSDYEVCLAMRYGNPSIASGIDKLRAAGCENVIVASLFPQASNTTTGTLQAEVARVAGLRRDAPALQFVGAMYEDRDYIRALADRMRTSTNGKDVKFHVFSFHGLPEEYVAKGDLYLEHCRVTAVRLAEELGLSRDQWEMVFQSRFGDEPWLQPFADKFVVGLAETYDCIAIAVPGFAADCLETVDEIGFELREEFEEAGGQELIVVPALNDHPLWIEALAQRVRGLESVAQVNGGAAAPQEPSGALSPSQH
jgi:ferrochelatase